MRLYFKKTGEGRPLLILHGLFGMSDNWMSLSRRFAESGFEVFAIDIRNHGRSPHADAFNYGVMSEDVKEFIDREGLSRVSAIGHSMGGKVAMWLACRYPELVSRLLISDISPRYYEPHHQSVIAAIHAVRLDENTSRKEAETQLRQMLSEESTVQFLLKNLYWNEEQRLAWRFNLDSIEKNIVQIGEALPQDFRYDGHTLFVRGERSGYIGANEMQLIHQHFPHAVLETIPDAGHWVHAENPEGFYDTAFRFLK